MPSAYIEITINLHKENHMKEHLDYLMRKCRDSAPHLTGEQVIAKCRAAARQEGQARIRTTFYVRRKMNEPAEAEI
jgi:hypothetical protein